MIDQVRNILKDNIRLRLSLISAVILGLLTHAYAYFSDMYGFDNISIVGSFINPIDAASGTKWLGGFPNALTFYIGAPWLCGIWTIILLAFTSYALVEIFDISNTVGIWLASGICVTNLAIISAHTYQAGELYHAVTYFLAVLAVFVVRKEKTICRGVCSSLLVAATCALYGSYAHVIVTLFACIIIYKVVFREDIRKLFYKAITYVLVTLAGLLLWYIVLRLLLSCGEVHLQSYGGENNISSVASVMALDIKSKIIATYIEVYWYYFKANFTPTFLYLGVGILGAGIIVDKLVKDTSDKSHNKKTTIGYVFALLLIVLILPIAMDFTKIISAGTHFLMWSAFCMPHKEMGSCRYYFCKIHCYR